MQMHPSPSISPYTNTNTHAHTHTIILSASSNTSAFCYMAGSGSNYDLDQEKISLTVKQETGTKRYQIKFDQRSEERHICHNVDPSTTFLLFGFTHLLPCASSRLNYQIRSVVVFSFTYPFLVIQSVRHRDEKQKRKQMWIKNCDKNEVN